MIYFSIFLIVLLCFAILGLIIDYNNSKQKFQKKIDLLEDLINELNSKLEHQNQKVRLSDDLRAKLKESNLKIGTSIFDLNVDMFSELYSRKSI